ncbi:hypothetical protein INT45_005160 [Circinella minor]|uniref:Enhancer of polycomb-like protein n=1 Tax=Circinella minor TaxID=1195481 RepID=A0A8H7VJH4_9FUNG|nr:hypothetical protein INT45_005160 [Circinella minor]
MTHRTKVKEIFTMRFAVKNAIKEPHILNEMSEWIINKIESGVEKKEENEHDLQVVLSEAVGSSQSIIPSPNIKNIFSKEEYHRLFYKNRENLKHSTSKIQFSMTVEDMMKGGQYFMDEKDFYFIAKYNNDKDKDKLTEDQFEDIMSQLEYVGDQKVLHLDLHWKARRLKRDGKSIIPRIQCQDSRTKKKKTNPYVCFRPCETSKSRATKKSRKSQKQAFNNLKKLRNYMEQSRILLDMVLRREKLHKQELCLEHTFFEKLCEMEDYEMKLDMRDDEDVFQSDQTNEEYEIETDVTTTTTTTESSLATIKTPSISLQQNIVEMSSVMKFKPEENKEKDAVYEDVTQYSYQPFPMELPSQFLQTIPSTDNKNNYNINTTPKFRKRIGRGGRVFIDRSIVRHDTMSLPAPYRFDSDSDYCEQANDDLIVEFEEMDDRLLDYHAPLLSINDYSFLSQQPATTVQLSTTEPSSSSSTMEALPSSQEHYPINQNF